MIINYCMHLRHICNSELAVKFTLSVCLNACNIRKLNGIFTKFDIGKF